VTDPAAAVEPGVDVHEHAGVGDPNAHHHSPEQIRKEMKVYIAVFIGLGVLTAVTVGAFYGLKTFPVRIAILVALIIASIKGFLVAGFFMHLLSEKKVIYGVLILTVIFFIFLMMLPVSHHANPFGS
jgi:cytochrome c oxidase subunit IV